MDLRKWLSEIFHPKLGPLKFQQWLGQPALRLIYYKDLLVRALALTPTAHADHPMLSEAQRLLARIEETSVHMRERAEQSAHLTRSALLAIEEQFEKVLDNLLSFVTEVVRV